MVTLLGTGKMGGKKKSLRKHDSKTNSKGTNVSPAASEPIGENEVLSRKRNEREELDPSPFNKGEVNFLETMFYDELAPNDEFLVPGTLGAPILKEEEGSNTLDLGDLLDRKRQKEANSSRSQECVVV